MSYEDGWAALNLEMPARIPRTEYSADMHWNLIRAVTGIDVGVESPESLQRSAGVEFMRAWNYDFFWQTLINHEAFGEYYTDMGHADYMAGGVDRREIVQSPFVTPEQVLAFDPWEKIGPIDKAAATRNFETDYKTSREQRPFGVNMTGIYITLVSGFIELFGWEMLLLAAGEDPVRFGDLANRYATWMQQYFDALAEADAPVVMVHDDMVWASGAIFRPAWYREYVFPNYKRYIQPLRDSGKIVIYCSDGDFTSFVDDIAQAGFNGFVFEPMTDLQTIVERYGQTHSIIGNVDTRTLLFGNKADIRTEVVRCMTLGKNCPGFFLAVGNHIPPNTPVENALFYNQVYEELSHR